MWNFADELFSDWIQLLDILHARDKLWTAAHSTTSRKAPKRKSAFVKGLSLSSRDRLITSSTIFALRREMEGNGSPGLRRLCAR